jgi:hypothetical protein
MLRRQCAQFTNALHAFHFPPGRARTVSVAGALVGPWVRPWVGCEQYRYGHGRPLIVYKMLTLPSTSSSSSPFHGTLSLPLNLSKPRPQLRNRGRAQAQTNTSENMSAPSASHHGTASYKTSLINRIRAEKAIMQRIRLYSAVAGVENAQDEPLADPVMFPTSGSVNNTGGGESSLESSMGSGNAPAAGTESTQRPPLAQNALVENKEVNMPETGDSTQNSQTAEADSESSSETENQEAEHVPLGFQIPETVLRTAMQASPNSEDSFYSHQLYRGPEEQTVLLHYCSTKEIAERVLPYFENAEVLGFDIEWKPFGSPDSIKENVSLIQIACEDRVALFHISRYKGDTAEELLPAKLKEIIESQAILKVGVAIKGDFSRMAKYLGCKPLGVFELSRLHNLIAWSGKDAKLANGKSLCSLANQVHEHLQLPLHKGSVRESDWSENKELSRGQLRYAATDAYASYRIYDALDAKRKKLKPIPPLPGLCDYDPPTRPRAPTKKTAKPKPEAADTSTAEQDTAEAAAESGEEQVDESEEYETAPEELMDSQDLEASSESPSSDESSDDLSDLDSDAEYVPPSRRVGRLRLSADETVSTLEPEKHRVSRVNLVGLVGSDVGYPELPMISSAEEMDSDSSDAFDPPVARPKRRAARAGITQTKSMSNEKLAIAIVDGEESTLGQFASTDIDDQNSDDQSEAANTHTSTDQPSTSTHVGLVLDQTENVDGNVAAASLETDRVGEGKVSEGPTILPTSEDSASGQPPNTPTPATLTKSSNYTTADLWAHAYLDRTIPTPAASAASSIPSRIRATVSQLRTYHLWHHQQLTLDDISKELRDPPLAQGTVCAYILQAVTLERLDYRVEDLRVLLKETPLRLRLTRFKWLVEKIGGGS